jgi:hypothetical protein
MVEGIATMFNATRRSLFSYAVGSVITNLSINSFASERPKEIGANPNVIKGWMDAWIKKKPVGVLKISRFSDPIYFLLQPISWTPNATQQAAMNSVHVPTGFVTDFASIPQIFWSALKPDGIYAYAAVLHDYLYWHQQTSKEEADRVFDSCMEDFGVGSVTRGAMYEAVNIFGGWAWKENRMARMSGERRVLQKYPEDPLTSWEDWKTDPNHFGTE